MNTAGRTASGLQSLVFTDYRLLSGDVLRAGEAIFTNGKKKAMAESPLADN